jgi:hypothetical protein
VRKSNRVFEFRPEVTSSRHAGEPSGRARRALPKHEREPGNRFNARAPHERLSAPERHALTILVRAAVATLIKER